MADLVNPYANPYLPSFVNQRPRINEPQQIPAPVQTFGTTFAQIHSANGFEGARNYARSLANGSSEIISESDPEIARIYIVAKDQNGQVYMEPFRLIPEEEPKPITMDDLNAKVSELLERMTKLEEENPYGESRLGYAGKAQRSANDGRNQSTVRNGSGIQQSAGNDTANATKQS